MAYTSFYSTARTAATSIKVSALTSALKEYYDGQKLAEIVFKEDARPFLSMLRRRQVAGKYTPIPWMAASPQGGAHVFSKAQENIRAAQTKAPLVSVKSLYRVGLLDTKLIRSVNDKGAFFAERALEVEWMLNELANDIEKELFMEGRPYYGQVSSVTTTRIKLTTDGDLRKFEPGMEVVFAATVNGTPTSRPVGVVDRIDFVSNYLYLYSTVTATVASDYIYREGDIAAASDKLGINGLPDWLPTAVTSADSFFGINRFGFRDRYAGVYKSDGDLNDIEGSIMDLTVRMANNCNARPNTILCDYDICNKLAKELKLERWRDPRDPKGGGLGSYSILGSMSEMRVIPCTFCPANTIYCLTADTWELISLGPIVSVFDDDGMQMIRFYNQDALEIRGNSYLNLVCYNPGANGRLKLA